MGSYEDIGKSIRYKKEANNGWRNLLCDKSILDQTPYCVLHLNLKQSLSTGYNRECISPDIAKEQMKRFIEKLNRKVYGVNFSRYKNRLILIPSLEYSNSKKWHYHVVIRYPKGFHWFEFPKCAEKLWKETKWGQPIVVSHHFCDIGIIRYVTKFKTEHCHIDEVNLNW